MTVQIVQLTDLHLVTDPTQKVKGVLPWDCLEAVLVLVCRTVPQLEWMLLTGDLSNDESHESYRRLRDVLGEWVGRCRIVPGNHDDRSQIRAVFGDLVGGGKGRLTFSLSVHNWRLIGLDTRVPGQVAGQLGREQLDWLQTELRMHADRPTCLFLHHHPIPTSSPWLEPIGLADREGFGKVIGAAGQVRAVFFGHIHQELEGSIGQAVAYGAPSTSFQFKPSADQPEIDEIAPGFRLIEMDGEELRTRVIRVGGD
jgi:Icc protein